MTAETDTPRTAKKDEEIAGLRKDAERYRWLRGDAIYCDDIWARIADSVDEVFDAAIDAAMTAAKEPANG